MKSKNPKIKKSKNKNKNSFLDLLLSCFNDNSGQSLIEILIALTIGVILIGAASVGVVVVLQSGTSSQIQRTATSIGEELAEKTRIFANADWNSIYSLSKGSNNTYFLESSSTRLVAVQGLEGILGSHVQSGLVDYWKLDSATGTIAYDFSNNDNDGTIIGAVATTTSTCKVGGCYEFDGVDDYISIADNVVTFDENSPWTLALWINPDSFSDYDGLFGNTHSAGAYQRLQLDGSGNIIIEDKDNSGGGVTYKVPHGMSIESWYHIVVINDGSDSNNITFFINSLNKGTVTMAMTEWEIRMIGGRGGSGHKFDGRIDDVRAYNRTLTVDEIREMYESTIFTRHFYVEDVCRTDDANYSIATTTPCAGGQVEDPNTEQVTINVDWTVDNLNLINFVTRFKNQVFTQSDWSGGLVDDSTIITEPSNTYTSSTEISTSTGSIKIEGL